MEIITIQPIYLVFHTFTHTISCKTREKWRKMACSLRNSYAKKLKLALVFLYKVSYYKHTSGRKWWKVVANGDEVVTRTTFH